jgi:transcriptional regulator with XRE-family HTH domain
MDMGVLGKRLRERREHLGLSQMEVAKQARIIQGDLSLLERGKKRALWADTLQRLAEALECSLDYLAGRTDDPHPPRRRRRRPVDDETEPALETTPLG